MLAVLQNISVVSVRGKKFLSIFAFPPRPTIIGCLVDVLKFVRGTLNLYFSQQKIYFRSYNLHVPFRLLRVIYSVPFGMNAYVFFVIKVTKKY